MNTPDLGNISTAPQLEKSPEDKIAEQIAKVRKAIRDQAMGTEKPPTIDDVDRYLGEAWVTLFGPDPLKGLTDFYEKEVRAPGLESIDSSFDPSSQEGDFILEEISKS